MPEPLERSDLPVGQQSNPEYVASTFKESAEYLNLVARVRAQVAEEVAVALRVEGEDVTDWQRGYRACAERALAILGLGPEHAGKAFPSPPAALPDVVGTPDHQEG